MTYDRRLGPLRSRARCALLLAALLMPLLAGCATPPGDPEARADFNARNDPIEPTNRDVFAFDQFLDPFVFVGGTKALYAGYARGVANGVDDRANNLDTLKSLEDNSLDFYATLRSVYRQHRNHAIAEALGKADQPEGSSITLSRPELIDP